MNPREVADLKVKADLACSLAERSDQLGSAICFMVRTDTGDGLGQSLETIAKCREDFEFLRPMVHRAILKLSMDCKSSLERKLDDL